MLSYAFSVITHKHSDNLAKCHAYDRDGADCTFSQDLNISTCQRIFIYYLCGIHNSQINFQRLFFIICKVFGVINKECNLKYFEFLIYFILFL